MTRPPSTDSDEPTARGGSGFLPNFLATMRKIETWNEKPVHHCRQDFAIFEASSVLVILSGRGNYLHCFLRVSARGTSLCVLYHYSEVLKSTVFLCLELNEPDMKDLELTAGSTSSTICARSASSTFLILIPVLLRYKCSG